MSPSDPPPPSAEQDKKRWQDIFRGQMQHTAYGYWLFEEHRSTYSQDMDRFADAAWAKHWRISPKDVANIEGAHPQEPSIKDEDAVTMTWVAGVLTGKSFSMAYIDEYDSTWDAPEAEEAKYPEWPRLMDSRKTRAEKHDARMEQREREKLMRNQTRGKFKRL